jgi:enamine deaminase RidA (YjgF/YER057c/UK114 family)
LSVRRIASGGPYEDVIGYSRAVIAGPHAYVSGCTALVDGMVHHEGDPYRQALTAFGVAIAALNAGGFGKEHVVRTRMYVTHPRDVDQVGRAHKELFDVVRPAATMVIVSKLIESQMLVEVELDAYSDGGAREVVRDRGAAPEDAR